MFHLLRKTTLSNFTLFHVQMNLNKAQKFLPFQNIISGARSSVILALYLLIVP
jgi:hypothetical protein